MKNELFNILSNYRNKFASSTNHQNIKVKRKINQSNKNLMNESITKIIQLFKKQVKKALIKNNINSSGIIDDDVFFSDLEDENKELNETKIEEMDYFENSINVIKIKETRNYLMENKILIRKNTFNCVNSIKMLDLYKSLDYDLDLIYSHSSNRKVSVDASFENCWKICKNNIDEIKMFSIQQMNIKTNLTNQNTSLKTKDSIIIKNFIRINTFNNNSASNFKGSKKRNESGYISFNKPMIDKSKYFSRKHNEDLNSNSNSNIINKEVKESKDFKELKKKSKSRDKKYKVDLALIKSSSYNYQHDYLDSDFLLEKDCLNDLFGISIKDTTKNISFPFSKIKHSLLRFDETNQNDKVKKLFNKNYKLVYQRNTTLMKEIRINYSLPDDYKFRNFAVALIMDGKLIIKMFLIIHENSYRVNISFTNKKFKNVEGFDYLPIIYEQDFFMITVVKYIIKAKKTQSSGELFHKCLNMLEVYNHPCIYNQITGTDKYNINPAINYYYYNLDLKKTLKDEQLIVYLAYGLKNCKYIVELNLEDNLLNDDFLKKLSEAFSSKNSIQKLGLSYNHFSNEGIEVLCSHLHNNNTLTSLGFYHNYIDDIGAKAIGEMLKLNKSLTTLNVAKNRFNEEGFIAIMNGLNENKKLKSIGFEFSKIKDTAASYVKEMLINNKCLEELNLSNNLLLDSGFKLICEGLIKNEYLNVLGMRKNDLTSQSIEYLNLILQLNDSLQYIYLCDNNIDNERINALIESSNKNIMITKIYLQENKISHDIKEKIRKQHKKIDI